MRNLLVALFVALFAVSAFAADIVAPAADPVVAPVAAVEPAAAVVATEFNGIIEVTPAAEGQTEATVTLDMGENTYKLVAADAAKLAELVALEGKTLTVTGALVAATEADAMGTITVESWVESETVVAPVVDEAADEEVVDDAPDAE